MKEEYKRTSFACNSIHLLECIICFILFVISLEIIMLTKMSILHENLAVELINIEKIEISTNKHIVLKHSLHP